MQADISIVLSFVDVHLWAILKMLSVIPHSQSGKDLWREGVIGRISHTQCFCMGCGVERVQ